MQRELELPTSSKWKFPFVRPLEMWPRAEVETSSANPKHAAGMMHTAMSSPFWSYGTDDIEVRPPNGHRRVAPPCNLHAIPLSVPTAAATKAETIS
jgi:hypothetical protein